MTETPHTWDRLPTETPKSYAAFLVYCALGAKRSVREAARQAYIKSDSTGVEVSMVTLWLRWSARHKWVSRSMDREQWIARTSDEQVVANVTACKLALTTRAHDFLASTDSEVFLRGARAFTLQHPPVQRVADVTQIEDLSHLTDEQLEQMREIRDEGRKAKGKTGETS